MSKQKLCKDCKHAKSVVGGNYETYYRCDRLGKRNPVDGEPIYLSSSRERSLFWRCGPKARFFEER